VASLDLQPDIRLMLIQGGVFVANFFIVKHFLVSPYLALKKARAEETEGASSQAHSFLKEADELEKRIEASLMTAFDGAKIVREKAAKKAQQDCKKIISEAKKRSDEHVTQVTKEIHLALKQERQKIASEASLLSGFLSSCLIPKEE
jgi:F0F1-type ATP synthase membrane subunit b/b'